MHRRAKIFCLLCIFCGFVYFYTFPPSFHQVFVPIGHSHHIDDPIFRRNDSYSFKNRLIHLNRRLQRAHRYAKSGVTISVLNEAHAIADSMLKDFFDYESSAGQMSLLPNVTENLHKKSQELEICPEKYLGMMYGYPYYSKGHVTDYANCSAKPLDQYLTILINAITDTKIKHLSRVLEGLSINYTNLSVTIAVPKNLSQVATHKLADSVKKKSFVDLLVIEPVDDQKYWDSAQIWKLLIENAKTKYVFVARGLVHFDDRISLERLTRMVSYLNVEVAAGSHRFSDGRWSRACFATAMKNYTFKIVEGYDLSYNSCIFCDYASGPFVAKRDFLLEKLNDTFSTDDVHHRNGLEFVDFYASIYVRRSGKLDSVNMTTMACPDVMFTVDSRQPFFDRKLTYDKSWWLPFVRKFELNKIILPDDGRLEFSCQESKTNCNSIRGLIMPICCLQELSDALKFASELFEEHNLTLEIEAGTGVGGVKLHGINPYERDADVDFGIYNYTQIDALAPVFAKRGYKLAPYPQMTNETECLHKDWINCGYYLLSTLNWSIEMWGVTKLGSDEAYQVGSTSRTKVFLDGRWMTSMYSPALSARNEYGDDIFQHVEHWGTLGYETGWVQPTTGTFSKCPHPGFHACLDRYLGVGNIQFRDVFV